jgi:class 3 adenylate cyclase
MSSSLGIQLEGSDVELQAMSNAIAPQNISSSSSAASKVIVESTPNIQSVDHENDITKAPNVHDEVLRYSPAASIATVSGAQNLLASPREKQILPDTTSAPHAIASVLSDENDNSRVLGVVSQNSSQQAADSVVRLHSDDGTNADKKFHKLHSVQSTGSKETAVVSLHLTETQQYIKAAKAYVAAKLESTPVAMAMAAMTIWALFSDDLRQALTRKDADTAFSVIISIGFFMFIFEIVAASFCKDDYFFIPEQRLIEGETVYSSVKRRIQFGSFYFWLDIIATLSLLFELPWTGVSIDSSNANRAGSASRAGARAGRIIRLVRMVRLVRLVKLYKYSTKIKDKAEEKVGHDGKVSTGNKTDKEFLDKESRVGAAMSDLTNRRVIVLVLVMLIVIPLLSSVDTNMEAEMAVQFIHGLAYAAVGNSADYAYSRDTAIAFAKKSVPIVLLNFIQSGVADTAHSFAYQDKIDLLRSSEIGKFYTESEDGSFVTILWTDRSSQSREESAMAIYTTLFVVVLLVLGTFFFSSDVNRLVIIPIERMVELVQKISANPLGVEYKMLGADDGFIDGMETTALLATITKIGRLMKVGFGEAGASVIAKNMSGEGGKLRLLGGGNMIKSIFGFCDVRQFTDTTECLQEEVMLFVNRIGHILHNIVVQCSGAANKNIGDAFLLTWKLEDSWTAKHTTAVADQALLCFCKALIELGRYEEFIINFSAASTARLYKRFPGYHVRIGSGLHVGWAVEGAIGSHRKIDASYLSPHVNFTEFLESSTKAYGTPLLISEPFFKLLSPAASKFVRQVDNIRKSQQDEPMGLYTYDSDLTIEWADPNRKLISKKLMPTLKNITGKFRDASKRTNVGAAARMSRSQDEMENDAVKKQEKAEAERVAKIEQQRKYVTPVIQLKEYTEDCWRGDPDLVDLRHRVNEKFRSTFHIGIDAYKAGDWTKAKDTFEHTQKLSLSTGLPDGPSSFLLDYMKGFGFVAPPNWKGYRREYEA